MSKTSLNKQNGQLSLMRLAATLIFATALAGCTTMTGTGGTDARPPPLVIDTSCIAFGPLGWSTRDTPETQLGNKGHNAAWDAICRDTGKSDPSAKATGN